MVHSPENKLNFMFAPMITIFVTWPLFPLAFVLVPLIPLPFFLYQRLTMNHHNWCRTMWHRLHILLSVTLEKFYFKVDPNHRCIQNTAKDMMELFAKIANDFQQLTIFQKKLHLRFFMTGFWIRLTSHTTRHQKTSQRSMAKLGFDSLYIRAHLHHLCFNQPTDDLTSK